MTPEGKKFYMYHKTPGGVSQQEFGENWDRIFGKKTSTNQNVIENINTVGPLEEKQPLIDPSEAFRKRVSDRAYFARLGKEPNHNLDVAAYLEAEKIELDFLAKASQDSVKKIEKAAENTTKTDSAGTQQKSLEIKLGSAIWNDQLIKITDAFRGSDGKDYVHVEGSSIAIPFDEIKYPKEVTKKTSAEADKTQAETEKAETDKLAKEREAAENKLAAEKAEEQEKEKQRIIDEKLKLEAVINAARKEGEQKGKEDGRKEGEKAGREKLLHEIEEKKNKNIFRRFGKFIKRHKKVIIAGAVGAVAVLATWTVAQYFGYFLPVPIKELIINAGQIINR